MAPRPSILCPVDFSDPSRTALHYAWLLAEHFGARLLALTVDDPLLTSAAEAAGLVSLRHATHDELRRFVRETIPIGSPYAAPVEMEVRVGKPSTEILQAAQETHPDLIVISSRGRGGLSKRFFGSTTERVLRETATPVLITPEDAARATSLSSMGRQIGHVLAPVDLGGASLHQVKVAGGIAAGLGVPLLLAHVLEWIYVTPRFRSAMVATDAIRREHAQAELLGLVASSKIEAPVEAMVLSGDPSEEIVALAEARRAGLIVVGLHASDLFGPRMGSVTYRILCLTRALVLALPPKFAASSSVTRLSVTGSTTQREPAA